jgi:acetate kinase
VKVIVCNIGSTSFKFQFIDMSNEAVLARVHIERVGSENAQIRTYMGMDDLIEDIEKPVLSQREAVHFGLDFLSANVIDGLGDIDAVGFKAVQAGEESGSVRINEHILGLMEEYRDLAPAHNPPYIEAMRMFGDLLPDTPLVGVFEPGFHTQKPKYAQIYGTPYEWFEKYGVRKYGYHGSSLRFVTGETVRRLDLDPEHHKVIACHLGGSSSICAYMDGRSIDTSLGFTPQTGLVHCARTGDIDAYVVPYIMKKTGMSMDEVYAELGSNGGLRGISGTSGDMRDVVDAANEGNERAQLARDKFVYDIKSYIGAFIVMMEGLDAVCFTGGIAMHNPWLRAEVMNSLGFLGFKLDTAANDENRERFDAPDSTINAILFDTDEEIIVARETVKVISG